MTNSVLNLTVAVLTIAIQAACIANLARKLICSEFITRCFIWAKTLLCGTLADGFEESPQRCKIDREFQKLLTQRRVKLAKTVAFCTWVAVCVLGVPLVVDLLSQGSSILANTSDAHLFTRVVLLLLLTATALFPSVMDLTCVPDVTHTMCMACLCSMAFSSHPTSMRFIIREMLSTSVLAVSGIATHFGVVAATNTVFLGCEIVGSIGLLDDSELAPQMINGHLWLFILRLSFCWSADRALKWVTRNEVEAGYEMRQQSAVSALLGMTCDAVVDLNSDLQFEEHFPKFAGMLMHGPGKSLQGQSLLDFVHDEDSDRVKTELNRSALLDGQQQPPPGMTTVSVRDSIGNRVSATLLHVPYSNIDGSLRYMVGVREDADASGSNHSDVGPCAPPEAELRPEFCERLQSGVVAHLPRRLSMKCSRSNCSNGSINSNNSSQVKSVDASFERSAEVFFFSNIPLRWMSDTFRSEIGVPQISVDGEEPRHELGDRMPDGGAALLSAMMDVVDKQRRRYKTGRFVKHLGEFDFLSSTLGTDESSICPRVTRRTVWINFYLPLLEDDDGFPFAAIAVSKLGSNGSKAQGHGGSTLKGTASSQVSEALFPVGRAVVVEL